MTSSELRDTKHWTDTVQSLNLRGVVFAGLAVFMAHFNIRNSIHPLPPFLVVDPMLTIAAFGLTVTRFHLITSYEPEMAAWWDKTIVYMPRVWQTLDFSFEGPWLFLITTLPFSTVSPTSFGINLALWSALETFYLSLGRAAIRKSPASGATEARLADVERYYLVRVQHEMVVTILAICIAAASWNINLSTTNGSLLRLSVWTSILCVLAILTFAESIRNPWYHRDLSVPMNEGSS